MIVTKETITAAVTGDWHTGSDPALGNLPPDIELQLDIEEAESQSDILVVAGDLLQKPTIDNIRTACSLLQIYTKKGKSAFFVLGNHDTERGKKDNPSLLPSETVSHILQSESGAKHLEGEVYQIRKGDLTLSLTGLNGYTSEAVIRRLPRTETTEQRRLLIYEKSEELWLPILKDELERLNTSEQILFVMHESPITETMSSKRSVQTHPFVSPRIAEAITQYAEQNPSLQRLAIVHGHWHNEDDIRGSNGKPKGLLLYQTPHGDVNTIDVYNVASPVLRRQVPGGRTYRLITFGSHN